VHDTQTRGFLTEARTLTHKTSFRGVFDNTRPHSPRSRTEVIASKLSRTRLFLTSGRWPISTRRSRSS